MNATTQLIANLFADAGSAAAQIDTLEALAEVARHNPVVAGALHALRAHPEAITLEQAMLVCILALDAALESTAALAANALARQLPPIVIATGETQ